MTWGQLHEEQGAGEPFGYCHAREAHGDHQYYSSSMNTKIRLALHFTLMRYDGC